MTLLIEFYVQTGGIDLYVIESSVDDNCDLICSLVKVGKECCSPSEMEKDGISENSVLANSLTASRLLLFGF